MNLPGWLYLSAISTTLFQTDAGDFRADQLLDRLRDERRGEEEVDLLDILLAPDLQLLGDRQLAQVRLRVVGEPDRAHVFRMVRHGLEVERPLDLDHVARGMLDRLAQRVLDKPLPARRACCRRRRRRTTSSCGVGLAEEDVTQRVLLRKAGSGPAHRPAPSNIAIMRRMANRPRFPACLKLAMNASEAR